MRLTLVLVVALPLLSLSAGSFADEKAVPNQGADKGEKGKSDVKAGQDKTSSGNAKVKGPVYKPPQFGAPGGRVGGGTRGVGDEDLMLVALVPNHLALTTHQQPYLYWYLSKPPSSPLEFAISEDKGVMPLVEKRLAKPVKGGIYSISLRDFEVELKQDVLYRWFVAVVPDNDRRSKDILAGGIVQRIAIPRDVARKAAGTDKNQLHYVYAEAGIWYDAMMAISQAIEADPGNQVLREERRALLQQVGLDGVVRGE